MGQQLKQVCRYFLPALFCAASLAHAATFYIDASAGSDANSGTSASLAWSSLAPVNQHKFQADDRVLFHSGQSWTGVLDPHGSGTAAHPIVLGSYGDGAKPLFKGEGADATLVLSEVSGWTVQDIAVTNHGANAGKEVGILLHANHLSSAIHLLRVDVSDVNGDVDSKSAGGISVYAWGKDNDVARFDDVLIDHCTVSHVDGQGIFFHTKNEDGKSYTNTNIRITGTTITDVGRNAIFLRGSLAALIDHNIVRFAAARTHGNAVAVGWSKDTVVRDNEISGTGIHTGEHENGAIDVDDGASGTIVEYNWSHDNVGGAVNVGAQPGRDCDDYGTIVRYNLSENDGTRAFGIGGAIHDTLIYNNTVYVGKGHSSRIVTAGQFTHYPQLPDGIFFARNVVYNEGKAGFEWAAKNVAIDGNCYLGRSPDSLLPDGHIVKDKTPLHLSGVPIQDRDQAVVYAIPAGSACAAASPISEKIGETDFLGTPLDANTSGTRGAIISSQQSR